MSEEDEQMHLFYYHRGEVRKSMLPEETVRILCPGRDEVIYFFGYYWETIG